ncbi:MAG TPA: ABC transporter permease [Gaiellaceae bacterium]|nr:ABC transporter permease [Gaiellaceae bacterium]
MSTATERRAAPLPRAERGRLSARRLAERWSLVLAFLAAFVFFSAARPDAFLTWDNARAILDDSSVLCVLAIGVTVILLINEFDLSVGFVAGLAGAAGVSVMAFHGWGAGAAVAVALAAGAAAGLANGVAVAYLRIPSFIATLAVGSIATAIELAITRTAIFEGLSPSYLEIATTRVAGVPLRAIIAGGVALLFLVLLRTTVYGRHATAVGDNPTAARLAGVPVERVKVLAFVLAGLTAGLAAVLVTSSGAQYYPNLGTGYLLPAYAAAFLGLSLGGGLRFNVLGSYLGVLLLGMLTTGLTMMNQPSWTTQLVQGLVLVVAVAGIALRRRGAVGR